MCCILSVGPCWSPRHQDVSSKIVHSTCAHSGHIPCKLLSTITGTWLFVTPPPVISRSTRLLGLDQSSSNTLTSLYNCWEQPCSNHQWQYARIMLLPVGECRSTASSVAEAKDAELERVLASNAQLRQDLAALQHMRMVWSPPHCSPLMHCLSAHLIVQHSTGSVHAGQGAFALMQCHIGHSHGTAQAFQMFQGHSRFRVSSF